MPTIEQIQELPAEHRQAVPADYIDRLGHMNVQWYFHLFGVGAMKLMNAIGYTDESIDTRRIGCFVLTQTIRYIAEAREGDIISIHSRVLGRSEKKLHHMHFMVNETRQNLAATLEALNIHADLTQRRSAPFPEDIAENIDCLLEQHNLLDWEAPVAGAMSA